MKDWQLWLKSFAINVLNPVNIAWWLSLYSLPPAADFSYSGKWIFGVAALTTVLFTELGVAWGAGKIKGYLTESRIRQIDLFLALLFFGMGIYLFAVWHISVSTELVDFGCKKAMILPSAPGLGWVWMRSNPLLAFSVNDSSRLSTSKAKWWSPSPFFSMNLAMVLPSWVAANNSIFTSPTWKNEVITF